MPTTHDGSNRRSIRLGPNIYRINDRVVDCVHLESECASLHHRFESYFIRPRSFYSGLRSRINRKPRRFILANVPRLFLIFFLAFAFPFLLCLKAEGKGRQPYLLLFSPLREKEKN